MADKEMIAAATLAAGVLAAAPPVLDPLAAAKEAASLCTESPPSTRTRSPGSQGLAGESAPRGFCPPLVFCGTTNPRPILGQNVSSGCIRMLNADVIDLYIHDCERL